MITALAIILAALIIGLSLLRVASELRGLRMEAVWWRYREKRLSAVLANKSAAPLARVHDVLGQRAAAAAERAKPSYLDDEEVGQ